MENRMGVPLNLSWHSGIKKSLGFYEQGVSKEHVGAYLRRWLGWAGALVTLLIGLSGCADYVNIRSATEAGLHSELQFALPRSFYTNINVDGVNVQDLRPYNNAASGIIYRIPVGEHSIQVTHKQTVEVEGPGRPGWNSLLKSWDCDQIIKGFTEGGKSYVVNLDMSDLYFRDGIFGRRMVRIGLCGIISLDEVRR